MPRKLTPITIDELPDVFTVDELRPLFPSVSRAALYNYVRAGTIPSVRMGRRLFIYKDALRRFLSSPNVGHAMSGDVGATAE